MNIGNADPAPRLAPRPGQRLVAEHTQLQFAFFTVTEQSTNILPDLVRRHDQPLSFAVWRTTYIIIKHKMCFSNKARKGPV
jgi:hypothetical protein